MSQTASPTPVRHHAGTRIEYQTDKQDPELSGWYIVYYDTDGEPWDGLGPYDTKDLAEHIANVIEED